MSQAFSPGVPGLIKAAVIVTFFNTWVLFEETVIDRYGWWEYLPYYRVAKLCAWDIGALALIACGTVWTLRRGRPSADLPQKEDSSRASS